MDYNHDKGLEEERFKRWRLEIAEVLRAVMTCQNCQSCRIAAAVLLARLTK